MSEENLKLNNPENFNRLDMKYRNRVQIVTYEKMLKNGNVKSEDEWTEKYSKEISNIIDNTENETIRSLIIEASYDRAADMIIEILAGKIDKKIAA